MAKHDFQREHVTDGMARIEEAAKAQVYAEHTANGGSTEKEGREQLQGGARLPNDLSDFTGRTQRNFEAVNACSAIWAQAMQETTQDWLELTRKLAERNLEMFTLLCGAKSVQDAAAIQNEVVRAATDEFVKDSRAIAETPLKANEAVRKSLAGK